MLDNRRNDPAPFGSLLAAVEQAYLRSLPPAWNRRPRAAVASPEGIIVAASEPCEAISMQALVHGMREFFGDEWSAGDVALTNDVYSGASHATEFTALTPLFRRDGGLEGWLGIRALFPDVGGWDLGSYSLRALDIWSEGIRIVPVKLARQGVARREIIQILRLNSRTPHLTEACARSFLAAAAEATPDRLSLGGSINVENSVSVTVSNIRSRAVAFLRELPAGRTLVEARAPVPGEGPIAIKVAVEVGQSGLKISFAGAPPARELPINTTRWLASDAVLRAVASYFDLDDAAILGLAGSLDIQIPDNSMLAVNDVFPVGHGRHVVCDAVEAAVCSALREFVPLDKEAHRVPREGRFVPALDSSLGTLDAQEQSLLLNIEKSLET